MQTRKKLWTLLLRSTLLSLTLTVSGCGHAFKPNVEPSRVCLMIPAPDLDTPTRWMMDYAVLWSDRLKCG